MPPYAGPPVATRGEVASTLRLLGYLALTIALVPLGFLLTGLQYALTAIKNLIDRDVWLSTSVIEGYDDTTEEEV